MRSSEQRQHDKIMVTAWRENLLALVAEAERAFRAVETEATFMHGTDDWVPDIERRLDVVQQRADALVSHVVHARNYIALCAADERR